MSKQEGNTQPMSLRKDYQVVMSNDLIKSRCGLSANATKLLRLTIMQVVKEDKDLRSYTVKVSQLADILGIDQKNIYRELNDTKDHVGIITELMSPNVVLGDQYVSQKSKGKRVQWCSEFDYDHGTITIKLHDALKPYVLELSKNYTQYILEDVLALRSRFAIRIYELIREELKYDKVYGNKTATVYLSMDLIRFATDTEDKYERISQFKARVINKAVEEINEKLDYHVDVLDVKKGRNIVGFNFMIRRDIKFRNIP